MPFNVSRNRPRPWALVAVAAISVGLPAQPLTASVQPAAGDAAQEIVPAVAETPPSADRGAATTTPTGDRSDCECLEDGRTASERCADGALPTASDAAAAPQSAENATTVDASRGGVTFSSGVNSLAVGARLQSRWTVDDREQFDRDTVGSGVGVADGAMSQFDDPRMRVTLGGGVFEPWLKYSFQFEMSRAGGEGGSRIKDAIIEIRPTGRSYRLFFGQFKAPFGLQQLTSSGRQEFVDRAITDSKFNPGRDMGVMFSGTAAAQKLGYAAGVFNGAGESVRQNNRNHLWVGRVFVNPLGEYRLAEGASDVSERPQLHVGFGARGGKRIRGRSAAGIFSEVDRQTAFNVEFALKAARAYSTAEYFWMTDEQRNPVPGPDIKSRGYHAQVGFMVVPRLVELGLRYARVDGDTALEDTNLSEVRGVFGYYWRSHNLKLQADIGQVTYDAQYAALSSTARSGLPGLGTRLVTGRSLSDTEFRLQVQAAF